MKRFQAPVVGSVLLVAVCAMAFAGLRTASNLWRSGLYTLVVGLLLFAVLAARFRRGKEGAFWFGFAVFGWGCFLLGIGSPTDQYNDEGAWTPSDSLNPSMLSTEVVLYLVRRLRPKPDLVGPMLDMATSNTIVISLCLVTVLVAVAGGLLAAFMKDRPRDKTTIKSLIVLVGLLLAGSAAASYDWAGPLDRYRPPSTEGSDFWWRGFALALHNMGEPPLSNASAYGPDTEIYRLLWLPSFHHPVCVRLDRHDDRIRCRVAVLDGAGGYDPGPLVLDQILEPTTDQWKALEEQIQRSLFWNMSAQEALGDEMSCDGDDLVVEGVKAGKYHVVDRTTPDPAFTEFCRYMLTLTHISMDETWKNYH